MEKVVLLWIQLDGLREVRDGLVEGAHLEERGTAPAKRFGIPGLEIDRAAEALDRLVEGLLSHRDHSLGVPSHWILGGQVKRFSQILLSARVIVHLGADVGAA